jgi:hypothetical protein
VTGEVSKFFNGNKIHVQGVLDGTYTYVTVRGAESVVKKYRLE